MAQKANIEIARKVVTKLLQALESSIDAIQRSEFDGTQDAIIDDHLATLTDLLEVDDALSADSKAEPPLCN